MKCSRCGNEIPSQSKFCLSCGQPVGAENGAQPVSAPATGGRKSVTVMAIVAGIILLAVAGFAYWRSSILKAPRPATGNQAPVVKAPNPANGPQADVLKTNVKNPPIDLNAPKKNPPPKEVVAYLEHLKAIESECKAMQEREAAGVMNAYVHGYRKSAEEAADENAREVTSPDAAVAKVVGDYDKEWQNLCAKLNSVTAPEPCAQLSAKYYDYLREVIKFMKNSKDMLQNGDVGTALFSRGKSGPIDEKWRAAEQELDAVCSKYGIDKSFSIGDAFSGSPVPVTGLPNTQAPSVPMPSVPTKP